MTSFKFTLRNITTSVLGVFSSVIIMIKSVGILESVKFVDDLLDIFNNIKELVVGSAASAGDFANALYSITTDNSTPSTEIKLSSIKSTNQSTIAKTTSAQGTNIVAVFFLSKNVPENTTTHYTDIPQDSATPDHVDVAGETGHDPLVAN